MDNVLNISKMASINGDTNNVAMKPGLDARNRRFVTLRGTVLPIQGVSLTAARELAANAEGRPKIPIKKVNYGTPDNPMWGEEAVPGDPIYLDEYKQWEDHNNHIMLVYIYATGVDIEVPESYKAEQKEFFPNRTPNEIKYFYITSILNQSEITPLLYAITGQNDPSEEGVIAAQAAFPSNGKG